MAEKLLDSMKMMIYHSQMGGFGQCAKASLCVINFFLFFSSMMLVGLGIWTLMARPYLEMLLGGGVYASAAYIVISMGCFGFFAGLLGEYGAMREVKCALIMYFIVTLLMFIVLLVGGILGFVLKEQANTNVRLMMTQTLKAYSLKDPTFPTTRAWDDTQEAFECCGIDFKEDWMTGNNNFRIKGPQVPSSCCKPDLASRHQYDCAKGGNPAKTFVKGCHAKVTAFVEYFSNIMGIVGIIVSMIMLLGIVVAVMLFFQLE